VPIYDQFTRWGFDPAKHKLQFPVADYSKGFFDTAWAGGQHTPTNWYNAGGGYLTDWRLQTSLPGLFASGDGPIPSQGCHGESHTTGRYCGRQAAVFARTHDAAEPCPEQIAAEKARVYAPVRAKGDIGWKEFNYAVSRIMADYCSTYKTEHTLELGIRRMKDLLATEGKRMYVNNPHELARAIEAVSLGELGVATMESVKAHRASNHVIGHFRNDYPEDDFEEKKFHGFKYKDGAEEGVTREIPTDFYTRAPYATDLEENYQKFGELDQ
jgi:succinate dehydrogenase/fumarate reductase flavoprotein subunit